MSVLSVCNISVQCYDCYIVCRVESLEAALREKETVLQQEKSKFAKLKEDFKYNLKLLNDRHAELDTYDSILAGKQTYVEVTILQWYYL